MGFKCGIVGLPNVGKSTLFNALTSSKNAQAANFPFCTIDPNIGIVDVPDERLIKLSTLSKSVKTINANITFVDIAGLVKGASKGEGLGNKFLSHIREVDSIVHLVRCFDSENIQHVSKNIDPVNDLETIKTEILLADIGQIEKKLQKNVRKKLTDKQIQLLENTGETLEGKRATVLGRSRIVGMPLSILLSMKGIDATVTIVHSKTVGIEKICRESDILISAIGVPNFVKTEWIKDNSIIIDVGISRIEDRNKKSGYSIVGDVEKSANRVASWITPVPGGVGPMTIIKLMENTIRCSELS